MPEELNSLVKKQGQDSINKLTNSVSDSVDNLDDALDNVNDSIDKKTKAVTDAIEKKRKKIAETVEKKKKSILNALSMFTVICNIVPTIGDIPKLVNVVKDALNNVIKFLVELLVTVLSLDLSKLQGILSRFLIKEINIFSNSLRFSMSDKLKSCFLCKINPLIPNWLITEGINLEIDSIDFRDMLRINPESDGGKIMYGGEGDMNRFLFEVIQAGGEERTWSYNSKPIAIFKFIESGSNVGYVESKDTAEEDNKGQQNSDKRNNVINMRIMESYSGDHLVNFINDYIRALDPIIETKKVLPNLLSKGYGTISRVSNLSIDSFRKQVEFDKSLELLFDKGATNDDFEIDNTFYTFSESERKDIDDAVNSEYDGVVELPSCCCGQSSISDVSIVSFNDRLNKSTTEEGDIEITNNAISQLSDESVRVYPVNERDKGYLDFFINIIQNIGTITIGMTLTPKLNFIIVMLNYMVTKNSRFINVREFFGVAWCIISDIMFGIIKKLIYGLLLPRILKSISNLLKCSIQEIIKKRISDDLITTKSLIPNSGFLSNSKLYAELAKEISNINVAGIGTDIASSGVDSLSQKASSAINNKK
tara:strand:- start:2506 stop:4284 length:1779 start_codon:yes stop_codon:yes gene_type:complete